MLKRICMFSNLCVLVRIRYNLIQFWVTATTYSAYCKPALQTPTCQFVTTKQLHCRQQHNRSTLLNIENEHQNQIAIAHGHREESGLPGSSPVMSKWAMTAALSTQNGMTTHIRMQRKYAFTFQKNNPNRRRIPRPHCEPRTFLLPRLVKVILLI